MKKLTVSFILLLYTGFVFAQTAPQMFAVYHDEVSPSMDAVYKENLKKLKAACEQTKANFNWITVAFDDNSYSHMVPIKSFADFDKNMMADLELKMGKPALAEIFAAFDKCVEKQDSYVVMSVPSACYLTPAPGDNFRDVTFWIPMAGKEAEVEKILQEWIKLYQSKNAPGGVLTYKALFGTEPGYAFISWGKNPVDLFTKEQKNNELFGEEAAKLWQKTLSITKRFQSKRAWVLIDHSNPPVPAVAANK